MSVYQSIVYFGGSVFSYINPNLNYVNFLVYKSSYIFIEAELLYTLSTRWVG